MRSPRSTILVVDDEPGVRELLRIRLEEDGYVCHVAPGGTQALEVLANHTIEVALLDVMMPKMTGLTLFQHMRQHHPDVAVVFVTAVDDLDLAVENLKNGAADYMVKPFTTTRLNETVKKALEHRSVRLADREYRRFLEDKVRGQAGMLEAKVRELTALNRMVQVDLSHRYNAAEGTGAEPATRPGGGVRRTIKSLQRSVKESASRYPHVHIQSRLQSLHARLIQCGDTASFDPARVPALLEQISAELRTIQDNEIRRAEEELLPPGTDPGLLPLLMALRNRFESSITVDLEVDGEIEREEASHGNLFPEELRLAVYRIVEEALDNVVRHSSARRATVRLSRPDDGTLFLEVEDEGRGFFGSGGPQVFGLRTMRDYAETLGGSFEVESVPTQGTRVHVTIPLTSRGELGSDSKVT